MDDFLPYIERVAGDRVTSDDWNELQEMIREEIRQHRHEGETSDSNLLGPLGSRLDNQSLEEAVIAEPDLADDSVTRDNLQERAFADWAVANAAAIPEGPCVLFATDDGHDHDGINSSPLAENSVGTSQLANGAVTEQKLAPELRSDIADIERRLAIPQALAVGTAPGSTANNNSYVDIIGHGFGPDPGVVRLLKVMPNAPGYYSDAGTMQTTVWTENKITVLLPADPTGLFQVEVAGVPLNPLEFDESLVVTGTTPKQMILDAPEDTLIRIEFSTELMIDDNSIGSEDGMSLMVLHPNTTTPVPLDHEPRTTQPYEDQPIEVYVGEGGARYDGELMISEDRKTVTFIPIADTFPWDTPVLVRIYGQQDQANKPILLASNNEQGMVGAAFQVTFTIRKKPPEEPVSVRIHEVLDAQGKEVSPANVISLANQHSVPVEIQLSANALPSEWVAVRLQDGTRMVEEWTPATAGGIVRLALDARALEDGPIQLLTQARNSTSTSGWVHATTVDPRTGEDVDWLPKDTKTPYLRVHPVRSPTQVMSQTLDVEVEPGSTVVVQGGARTLQKVDENFSGHLHIDVPLNPNTTNRLRVQAMDKVGNPSKPVTRDMEGASLTITHDDTIPELHIDPVRTPTRARTIVLTGRSNEPVTVVVTSGGQTQIGTTRLNQSFRIPLTLMPNRLNHIKIVATDATGNTSPPIKLHVLHDDQPPFLKLHNKGYHRFVEPESANPSIYVRGTRVAIGGKTEPGATVILTGHGHRVTTRAGGNGTFTLNLPFQLEPRNKHARREERRWSFQLDAVDPSGNYTNNRKNISVILDYQIPGKLKQRWVSAVERGWRNANQWHRDPFTKRYVFYYCDYKRERVSEIAIRPALRPAIEKVAKKVPDLVVKKEYRDEIDMRPIKEVKPQPAKSRYAPEAKKPQGSAASKEKVQTISKLQGNSVAQKTESPASRRVDFLGKIKML